MCLAVQLDEKQASNGLSNKTKRPLVLYFFVLYFFVRSFFVRYFFVRYFFEVPFGLGRKILEPIEITSFFLDSQLPLSSFNAREKKIVADCIVSQKNKNSFSCLETVQASRCPILDTFCGEMGDQQQVN